MTSPRRPRVAAIRLDDSQLDSIAHLCGDLRPADSLGEYLDGYDWTETDVVVSSDLHSYRVHVDKSVNIMVIGSTSFYWSDPFLPPIGRQIRHYAKTNYENTERELATTPDIPKPYAALAAELSKVLGQAAKPPAVLDTSRQDRSALIETTSGHPVALRLVLPARSGAANDEAATPIALLLPAAADLAAWFTAFLCDVHDSDHTRVPHAPPRLSKPEDWYTRQERELADRISEIDSEIERLTKQREQLQTKLTAEGEKADNGIRRALWAGGDELVDAAGELLSGIGFIVRNMDAELEKNEPKREDLRLTHQDRPGWQAMVEVKGYASGTKTNDARQIREHRDLYIAEERRPPDLTVWLANPHRTMDSSSRPAPDQNVNDAAASVGAVHVLATDLYRQWALVESGILDAEAVVQSLANADPGLWIPPVSGSGT